MPCLQSVTATNFLTACSLTTSISLSGHPIRLTALCHSSHPLFEVAANSPVAVIAFTCFLASDSCWRNAVLAVSGFSLLSVSFSGGSSLLILSSIIWTDPYICSEGLAFFTLNSRPSITAPTTLVLAWLTASLALMGRLPILEPPIPFTIARYKFSII